MIKYKTIVLGFLFFFIACNKNTEEIPKLKEYEVILENDIPKFDSENTYKFIEEQIAFGPRNPNSIAHKKAKDYFKNYFLKYTDNVELQKFQYVGYDKEVLDLTNIIVKFNPQSKKRIMFSAHWDSRPWADKEKEENKRNKPILGANDGASGVAVLMELAKILKEKPVDYGIDIILFDGEDYGKDDDLTNFCIGSKYFANTKESGYKPMFGILLDLVGDKKAQFAKEEISRQYAPEIVELVWSIAKSINADKFSTSFSTSIYDDHLSLNQVGIKTINIIDAGLVGGNNKDESRNYWHTHNDDIRNISKETLQQVGDVLVKLIYSLKIN